MFKMKGENMTRQKSLTEELAKASEVYYNDGHALMSDLEFDHKVEELKKLEAESGTVLPGSPTQNVGAKAEGLKKARHEQPALSLDKVKYADRESLKKWLDYRQGVMMWKCDGSTVVLTYDNGKLTSAVTRGNGEEGSVITHNAKFFKGVPETIPCSDHVVVRGEAMMTNAEFEKVNAEAGGVYENARNLATATIQMLDANESRKREIIFKAFELVTPGVDVYIGDDVRSAGSLDTDINLQFMSDRLDWMKLLGFDVVEYEYSVYRENILDKIENWKEKVKDLPYPTDGLVISYDDLKKGWALGSTGHHPRWAMALKWTDETYTTTIRDIEWSVGKTGIITPVAVFDEVRMGLGSNVTRASLHNVSILKKLAKVTGNAQNIPIIGSKAEVYMANMIIPNVESISHTPETVSDQIPYRCPVCGELTSLVWNPDSNTEVLMCTNHDGCPAQQIGKLMNTFSKDGLFVKGLGESQIEDLLNARLVTADPRSFYEMAGVWEFMGSGDYLQNDHDETFKEVVYELLDKDGWGQKKWDNLIDAINASRETTLQKFLYSLNIPLLGNDLSKKLSKYWNDDINNFVVFIDQAVLYGTKQAFEELLTIDGVGEEKANNICDWLLELADNKDKYDTIKALINELVFPEPKAESSDNSLEGLTFVITGSVHQYKNRDEFKASIEARGGKVAGSVSAKTSFLVNNDVESTSGKNQKAKELGIEIISEDEFIARFGK